MDRGRRLRVTCRRLLPAAISAAIWAGCGEVAVEPDAGSADASDVDASAGVDATPQPDSAPGMHTLTVDPIGAGTGIVTSSPAGIDCGGTCSADFLDGTVVTLTAAPTAPNEFGGWLGACTGTGSCVVTMDQALTVNAVFNPPGTQTLAVIPVGAGAGTVTSDPAGIDCGATCSANFIEDTIVTLSATPTGNDVFGGWGGDCSGSTTCALSMDAAKSVTATFHEASYTLTVTKSGAGSGTVTSTPVGIDCGTTCADDFVEDTVVTLTATPTGNDRFAGWGGACSGTGTCVVTMDSAKSLTAVFDPPPNHTLTVATSGSGEGTVTSTPAGINCGAACAADYVEGTIVTLTANPNPYHVFDGWSGACTGTEPCVLTIDAPKSVVATFSPPPLHTLTVQVVGNGWVGSNPDGIDCGLTCSATYEEGTGVTLFAQPADGVGFAGWSGSCSGLGPCVLSMPSDLTVIATFEEPNIVFATTGTYDGNLGGITGADAICNGEAALHGLGGTYLAWISDDDTDAIDRFEATGARGWMRPDGVPVIDSVADLTSGRLYHPIRIGSNGTDLGNTWFMTSTGRNGRAWSNAPTCLNWSSNSSDENAGMGVSYGVGPMFTAGFSTGCSSMRRLHCWGVDKTVALPTPQAAGRYAFVSQNWAPGGGVSDADAQCQAEADAAGLPGSYLAVLPTIGASAASRFDTTGPPWMRTDGVAITQTAALFFTAVHWDSSPNVTADGNTFLGNYSVWGGTDDLTTAGAAANTCNDWTSTSVDDTAKVGLIAFIQPTSVFASWADTCDTTWSRVVCLQE